MRLYHVAGGTADSYEPGGPADHTSAASSAPLREQQRQDIEGHVRGVPLVRPELAHAQGCSDPQAGLVSLRSGQGAEAISLSLSPWAASLGMCSGRMRPLRIRNIMTPYIRDGLGHWLGDSPLLCPGIAAS